MVIDGATLMQESQEGITVSPLQYNAVPGRKECLKQEWARKAR